MDSIVHDYRAFGKNVNTNMFEVHIHKLHVDECLLTGDDSRHIDPLRWRPLIMSFCRFFDLGGEVHPSRLAESNFRKAANPPQRVDAAIMSLCLPEPT
jgi:hypothetical protein